MITKDTATSELQTQANLPRVGIDGTTQYSAVCPEIIGMIEEIKNDKSFSLFADDNAYCIYIWALSLKHRYGLTSLNPKAVTTSPIASGA